MIKYIYPYAYFVGVNVTLWETSFEPSGHLWPKANDSVDFENYFLVPSTSISIF